MAPKLADERRRVQVQIIKARGTKRQGEAEPCLLGSVIVELCLPRKRLCKDVGEGKKKKNSFLGVGCSLHRPRAKGVDNPGEK